jgi:site-specific recombinase XerD
MRLLHAGIDIAVIALLGHEHVETTQVYLQAATQRWSAAATF